MFPLSPFVASLESSYSSVKEMNCFFAICLIDSKEILVYFYKIKYCFICLNLTSHHPDSHLKIKIVLICSEIFNICNSYHTSV